MKTIADLKDIIGGELPDGISMTDAVSVSAIRQLMKAFNKNNENLWFEIDVLKAENRRLKEIIDEVAKPCQIDPKRLYEDIMDKVKTTTDENN